MRSPRLENPIFVALDVDSGEQAIALARQLKGRVGGFKVGPRLLMRNGGQFVAALAQFGEIFVDNKYLDIPNTMVSAVQATFEAGASYATVHTWAGPEAMARLAQLEAELNRKRPFRLLAVTVLTSFTPETLPGPMRGGGLAEQVLTLAKEAQASGIHGLVCSPLEVESLRQQWPESFLVTPGIRFADEEKGDQRRVLGPREALELGASALVVGRPICDASDPVAAADRYFAAIRG